MGTGPTAHPEGRPLPSQVAGAYSKTWSHREDALLTLHKQLTDTPVGTPKEDLKSTLRAAVFLVRRAIRDIVTPVSPATPQGPPCLPRAAGPSPGGQGIPGSSLVHSLSSPSTRSLGMKTLSKKPGRRGAWALFPWAVPSGPVCTEAWPPYCSRYVHV